MKFMKYATDNHCNIIPKKDFDELVENVFNIIATNLTKSLGPLGSSATILNGSLTVATKDGYQILENYNFNNSYMRMIYNLIKKPCTKMNNTVGDGTTTAIALTNALFKEYTSFKNVLSSLYRLPRQFTKAWDEVIENICQRIQEKATTIDPEDYDTIYNIAYVVSNGSEDISKEIAKTYKESKSPSIKQKDSPTNKSYIAPIRGFEFPANIIDEIFVKNQDGSSKITDAYVLVFDHMIDTDTFDGIIIPINNVVKAMNHKLIILAPEYDKLMLETTMKQYIHYEFKTSGTTNLILTAYSLGKLEPFQMTDLATVLKGRHINQILADEIAKAIKEDGDDVTVDNILNDEKHVLYRAICHADEALLTFSTGAIFQVEDVESDERYNEVLNKAKADLQNIINQTDAEKQSYSAKIHDARARVNQLEMNNYIYYVGADSDLQKQITWAAIEDVIKCVRSAIRSGVVPGCQITIIRSCQDYIAEMAGIETLEQYTEEVADKLDDDTTLRIAIAQMIIAAVSNVYQMILHGADGTGMIKILEGWDEPVNPKLQDEAVKKIKEEAVAKGDEIVLESIKCNKAFDLETLTYNDKIITSAETDVMVLTAASELVKVLISGNQCIFVSAENDILKEEDVSIYA